MNHLTQRGHPLVGIAVAIASVCAAHSAPINDAGVFNSVPHRLLTFDRDGAGNVVTVTPGSGLLMPADEYALQGVRFSPAIDWVNDSGADFDAAQAIGGSLPIGIPGSQNNDIMIELAAPVRAFGFWVIQNTGSPQPTVFTAIDNTGQTIESVTFGSAFRDGAVGVASYGFMGIDADRDVARIHVTKGFAMLDNFHTSQVPEPSSAALIALVTAVALVRARPRRRR